MTFSVQTRRWHWLQITIMVALGVLAIVSAAWGKSLSGHVDEQDAQAGSPQTSVRQSRVFPQKSIVEINIDPRDHNERKPADKSPLLLNSAAPLHWFNTPHPYQTVHWTAPNIRYEQLYFEDVGLERYGQTAWGRLDFARTLVLFYGDWLALPHNALKLPPHTCDTPLGFARPGTCAPATGNYLFYRN
jgi:hypothetical protein